MDENTNDDSVYELVTKLCSKCAGDTSSDKISQTQLMRKMRARSFEVLLNKYDGERVSLSNPISELLAYYFVCKTNISNVIDYENSNKLGACIDALINSQKEFPCLDVLKFLVLLKNSELKNVSGDLYKRPLTLGEIDYFLPRQSKTTTAIPYQYFPENMFHLPFKVPSKEDYVFSMQETSLKPSKETFFCLPREAVSSSSLSVNIRSVLSIPRLLEPRDLIFSDSDEISLGSKSVSSSVIMCDMEKENCVSSNIWDVAQQMGQKLPIEIWDMAAKQRTTCEERCVIAQSRQQLKLWRKRHNPRTLSIISEDQLIRHISYLCIGIESASFVVDKQNDIFRLKSGLSLQGISNEYLYGYLENFLLVGTCYMRLYRFAFEFAMDEKFKCGFIYEAARNALRSFLLSFRQKATKLVEECVWDSGTRCLPSLLKLLHWIEPLKDQIMTVASIYRVIDVEGDTCLPKGAALMSYLYREICLVTHPDTAQVMFAALHQICNIYFKFIEKLIFEGELEDPHSEFFIRRSPDYINTQSRRYWERGLHLSHGAVPDFIAPLARLVLLCGKSLRLLKICNPHDPLIILLSGDHPTIECCTSFQEVEEQKKILDLYRTRCLFVSGEPVTFDQILLKADAEKKACREMATIKQAETLDKIVADRKRLATLIQAEKQHSLKLLEAAIARNKASKEKGRLCLGNATGDYTDSKDRERDKIEKYYSKLNEEVEKRKVHAEWKMKRLQLVESRMQLLSSEERKYKREKLEREHGSLELSVILECAEPTDSIIDLHNNNKEVDNDKNSVESSNVTRGETSNETVDEEGNIITEVDTRSVIPLLDTDKLTSDAFVQDALNKNVLVVNNAYIENSMKAAEIKRKVLGTEFGLAPKTTETVIPKNDAQSEAVVIRNRMTESDITNRNEIVDDDIEYNDQNTAAKVEAESNRIKSFGSDFNLEGNISYTAKKPLNVAQVEAIKNKNKVLNSEYGMGTASFGSPKRAALKLNLNAAANLRDESASTQPTPAGITPSADLFAQLDLETPTTAEVQIVGQNYQETPPTLSLSQSTKHKTIENVFKFPTPAIVEDEIENTIDDKLEENVVNEDDFNTIWDVEESYDEANFDPFNVKDIDIASSGYFTRKLNEYDSKVYSDVRKLIEETTKKPYTDIFEPNRSVKEDEEMCQDVSIATLRACLQRSVLLPLSYQLEVVNNSILTYFLVDLDLYGHLQSLKDYFFLMDGEFCSTICHNLFSKLSTLSHPEELLNFTTLHGILDKAIVSSISSSNKYAENLSFTLSEPLWPSQSWPGEALQGLSLSYSVIWPLDVVLSPDTMKRYTEVFHFLLKMRRVAWMLGNDFEALKISAKLSRDKTRRLLSSPQYHAVQIYRHVMASLMRALDNYIVTTCIQTSWKELEHSLREARTLDDLHNLHVLYVKKVMFRCLLNKRSVPLMKVLDDIFNVVLRFSKILNNRDWVLDDQGIFYTTPCYDQLHDLYILCERLTRHLHRLVCKLLDCGYQPHLNELLALINLNEYYHPLPH